MKWLFVILIVLSQSLQAQTETWTVQTLKEYVDQRFESMQEAVNKSETSVEKRFESVNEFRNTLADQQRTFVAKSEYDASYAALLVQVSELKARLDKYESAKAGGVNTIAYITAAVSFLIAIFALSKNFITSVYRTRR